MRRLNKNLPQGRQSGKALLRRWYLNSNLKTEKAPDTASAVWTELQDEQYSTFYSRKGLSQTEWKSAWPEQRNEQTVVTGCRRGRQDPDQVGLPQDLVSSLGSALNTVKIYWRVLTMKITFSIYILHHSSSLKGSKWL